MNEKFIEKLKSIKMKPKWHFVFKGILLFALFVFVLILTLYLFSLMLFSFGRPGIPFSPWISILFVVILVLLLDSLLNKHTSVYSKPIIYSLLIIIFLLFVMGFIINQLHFHERIERRDLPGVRRIYHRELPFETNIRRPL